MLPKLGDTIGGKYMLEVLLGRGGMGAVFRAKNLLTGRRVALKWMLPSMVATDELRARIFREARAMGRIEHPNVCAVYDVGEDHEAVFLVMELLEGRSLRSLMSEGPMPVEEASRILLSAMQGVAAAHAAGVVHRDLKPDNLFVCNDAQGDRGATKVLDFGVSKILDPTGKDSGQLTKTGTSVGTPHYMSPEQVLGDKDIDPRTDVYALGAILFEAVAGRVPHDAEGFSALMVRIATSDPERFASVAPPEAVALDPIVHRALARFRDDRYPDVAAFAAALEPFAGGAKFALPKARPRSEPPPPRVDEASSPRIATAVTQLAGMTPSPAGPSIAVDVPPITSPRMPVSVSSPTNSSAALMTPPISDRRPWLAVVAVVALAIVGWGVYRLTPTPDAAGVTAPNAVVTPTVVTPPAVTPRATSPATVAATPEVAAPIEPAVVPTAPIEPAPREAASDPVDPRPEPRAGRHRREPEVVAPVVEEPPTETALRASGRSGTLSSDEF